MKRTLALLVALGASPAAAQDLDYVRMRCDVAMPTAAGVVMALRQQGAWDQDAITQINTNWPEQVPSLAMDVQEQQFTRDYAMALIPVAWMMPIVPEDQKDTAVHIFVETIRQVCHQRIMF